MRIDIVLHPCTSFTEEKVVQLLYFPEPNHRNKINNYIITENIETCTR